MAYVFNTASMFIQCQGNSLTIGDGVPFQSGLDYPSIMKAKPPISGSVTVANNGSSGLMMTGMRGTIGTSADSRAVHPNQGLGRLNILFVWEGTNTIGRDHADGRRTGAQAAEEMRLFLAERLAAFPGYVIVLMTTLPMYSGYWGIAQTNAHIDEYNAILRENWQAWGVAKLLDLRKPGSPFAFTGYTLADFQATEVQPLWKVGETSYTHLSAAGYEWVATQGAQALTELAAVESDPPPTTPNPPAPPDPPTIIGPPRALRLPDGKFICTGGKLLHCRSQQ